MILRRLSDHVKDQNWFAVVLDFCIVVGGVFIGVQLGNWNEARMNEQATQSALLRLRAEIDANIRSAQETITRLEDSFELRSQAIAMLDGCDDTPDAAATLALSVYLMAGDIIPPLVNNMSEELAREDRHSPYLSQAFLKSLNQYNGELSDEIHQLEINFGLMWDAHVIHNPAMVFDAKSAKLETIDVTLAKPISELCQDTGFKREYILTNIWHESTHRRLERFLDRTATFTQALDTELGNAP